MLKQLKDCGGEVNNLALHEFAHGFVGMRATSDIDKGEVVQFIPNDLIIDQSVAQKAWSSRYMSGNINGELSLCLMEHRKDPNSKWKNWIRMLPKSYSEFPLFWSKEDIEGLEGSPLKTRAIKTRSDLEDEFNLIASAIPEFKAQNTLQDFLESYSCVTSRTFNHDSMKKGTAAFVPIADMINHSPELANCEYQWDTDAEGRVGWFVRAGVFIRKDSQVFYSYGKRDNAELLMNYGFTLSG